MYPGDNCVRRRFLKRGLICPEVLYVLQDPRRLSFLILPAVIAVSGIAAVLSGLGSVSAGQQGGAAFTATEIVNVLLEGESTSDPADGWNSYPVAVGVGLGANATVTADGDTGVQISEINSEGPKLNLLSGTPGLNVGVLWIGINDISHGNEPNDVYREMSTWVKERRAEGWDRIVVVTVTKFEATNSLDATSWGSHELADAKRQELNSLIVDNATGADVVVDLREVEGVGDQYGLDDTDWRSDKMHFTAEGNEMVARHVVAAIQSLAA